MQIEIKILCFQFFFFTDILEETNFYKFYLNRLDAKLSKVILTFAQSEQL